MNVIPTALTGGKLMFEHTANLEIRGPSRQDELHDGGDYALTKDNHIIAECYHIINYDLAVDSQATATLFQAAYPMLQALLALGSMPEGYCFCYERDPQKPEEEHTGECQMARAALRKLNLV